MTLLFLCRYGNLETLTFCSTACSRFFGDVNIGLLEIRFGNGNFDYLFYLLFFLDGRRGVTGNFRVFDHFAVSHCLMVTCL